MCGGGATSAYLEWLLLALCLAWPGSARAEEPGDWLPDEHPWAWDGDPAPAWSPRIDGCFGHGRPSGDDCQGIEWVGACEPDTQRLFYCWGDSLYCKDCAADGEFCGWYGPTALYNCRFMGGAPGGQPPYCVAEDPWVSCPHDCWGGRCGPAGDGTLCGICPAGEVCAVDSRECRDEGPGCAARWEPGCGGCECEAAVCATDPCCCDDARCEAPAWRAGCVDLCRELGGCAANAGCVERDGPGCDGCPREEEVFAADSYCRDTRWDSLCVEAYRALTTCGEPSGCYERAVPGCVDCACRAEVCADRESCCTVAWDSSCVRRCGASATGCGRPTGCYPAAWPGCDGCSCRECVCALRPYCCDTRWDYECARLCAEDCGGCPTCDEVPGSEMCDGRDNDCDGETDEGFGVGEACSAGLGACRAEGVWVCAENGRSQCSAVRFQASGTRRSAMASTTTATA